jgi:serine/threonine protein kinase
MSTAGTQTTATRGANDPLVGMTIAGCKVLRRIGNRATGIVYDVQRLADAQRLALRLLAPEAVAKDPTAARRFRDQGEALIPLKHAHLVRVHATGEDAGFVYWLIDLVEGASLAEIVSVAGRMPWIQAGLMMRQVAAAAAVVDAAGLSVAGASPATVIITSNGDARLVDQALARALIKPPPQAGKPLLGLAFTPPEDLDPQAHPTSASLVLSLIHI